MRRIALLAALAAAPGSAEPGFGPGANCFVGTFASGTYPPADLREMRFALDLRQAPVAGETPGPVCGVIAVRFGPPSVMRREYFNAPVCWLEAGAAPLLVTQCGGEHDSEQFTLGWEGETLILTTRGLTVEQGDMPDVRTERLKAAPGTTRPPELDPDLAWLGAPVHYRLARAPAASCAGIGPWERDY